MLAGYTQLSATAAPSTSRINTPSAWSKPQHDAVHRKGRTPELRRLGYEEGHNLLVERYSANGQTNTYAEFAAHIVGTRPDLIFTVGSLVAKRFATATDKIP